MAIVVATLIFAVGWNTYALHRQRNILIASCAFLGVAVLDFSHMLSFPGMPDFVTPSDVEGHQLLAFRPATWPPSPYSRWSGGPRSSARRTPAAAVAPALRARQLLACFALLLPISLAGSAVLAPRAVPAVLSPAFGLTAERRRGRGDGPGLPGAFALLLGAPAPAVALRPRAAARRPADRRGSSRASCRSPHHPRRTAPTSAARVPGAGLPAGLPGNLRRNRGRALPRPGPARQHSQAILDATRPPVRDGHPRPPSGGAHPAQRAGAHARRAAARPHRPRGAARRGGGGVHGRPAGNPRNRALQRPPAAAAPRRRQRHRFELSVAPLGQAGQSAPHFIVLSRDVTARTREQESLRQAQAGGGAEPAHHRHHRPAGAHRVPPTRPSPPSPATPWPKPAG